LTPEIIICRFLIVLQNLTAVVLEDEVQKLRALKSEG